MFPLQKVEGLEMAPVSFPHPNSPHQSNQAKAEPMGLSDHADSHALLHPRADRLGGQARSGEWTYLASLPRDHQL